MHQISMIVIATLSGGAFRSGKSVIVDADAILALAIALEPFKPIARCVGGDVTCPP